MRKSFIILAAAALVFLTICAVAEKSETPNHNLAFVADEQSQLAPLTDYLRQQDSYDIKMFTPEEMPERLESFAAVFMYIHGKMERQTEKALLAYARNGGRLIILHHGIASARVNNPDWLAAAGIYIAPRSDPDYPWRVIAPTTHTLVNLNPGHYITTHKVKYDRQIEYRSSDAPSRPAKYPALDLPATEVFLNQHFTGPRDRTVLFGFHCVDPVDGKVYMQDRSGWYKPHGKGWLFYLQPGHCKEDFQNPNYAQIITNCLTWNPTGPST